MNHETCQHCGYANCQDMFHHALTLDFTDLEYGAVHHLLVTTYMLQHNRYTATAAKDIVAVMQTLLETTPSEYHKRLIRQQASNTTHVIRREPAPPLRTRWHYTIGGVDISSNEAYIRTVRAWATATFAEFLEIQP
jgi:hypothetical protein